jgi:molecular chaperone Hsp33
MENMHGKSHWVKCISTHGSIRGVAVDGTELIREMAKRHGLVSAQGIKGLGESVLSALLIASYCKQDQHINLNIQGSGFYKQALIDAYPNGSVRGYVVERDTPTDTKMDSGEEAGPWGNGFLSVLRTKNDQGEKPYISTIPLLTGHLAKDLSFYWVQSEQIPTAVGLSVNIEGNHVTSAAAFLVQALPGANQAELRAIEQHIFEIRPFSEAASSGMSPVHLLSLIFQNLPFMLIEEKPLQFNCTCSWDRVQKALVLIGTDELRVLMEQDQGAMVRCDFCSREYRIDRDGLSKLIEASSG